MIYDDTVALRNVIHTLNNPLGRTFKRSTLGKAYYYMGRNLAGAFYDLGQMDSAAYYATKIVHDFNIPAHKVSAYYILHKYAILNNDILAADSIAGLRMDEKRKAETKKLDSLEGIQVFEEYLAYCEVYRRRVLLYCLAGLLALSVVVALLWYWQRAKKRGTCTNGSSTVSAGSTPTDIRRATQPTIAGVKAAYGAIACTLSNT